jgi:hypothetical protein
MHWILQDNLFNEAAYQVLLDTLVRLELPHSVHKVVPFVGELVPPPDLGRSDVICMGSYSLRHAAKRHGWAPGVYDLEPFDFTVQLARWGDHMLNAASVVSRFEDANFDAEAAFLRPIEDSKVFAGRVFSREEFYEWKRKVCVLEHDYGNSLSRDTLIQVAPPLEIYVEARCWVVGGKIVTSSIYKRGDKVIYDSEVPPCYLEYAQARVDEWAPLPAFVIDVADTAGGMRVVEINTINSCGFYAADIPRLVIALEELNA